MHTVLKRIVAAAGFLTMTSAFAASGEFHSIAVWNGSTEHAVEDVAVTDVRNGNVIASEFSIRQRPATSKGWRDGGPTIMADGGLRVPPTVSVRWRLPAAAGSAPYTGPQVGPYSLDIRSQIPDDVFAKVTGSTRYQLSIGIRVGVEPVTLRWVLFDKQSAGGTGEVSRGGDWQ